MLASTNLYAQEAPDEPPVGNRFFRTVYFVQNASAELQANFSSVALSELALAHATEAELAREEIERSGPNSKLRHWAASVDRYAKQLEVLIEEIATGIAVSLVQRPSGLLALTAGERMVILSHPRLEQQSAFEQSILANFCTQHACDRFTPGNLPLTPIAVSTASVSPDWDFSGDGHTCKHLTINVLFSSDSDLVRAKLICTQFLQEVMTLVDEIAWQQRHGVVIDWNNVKMFATPARPEHRVALNVKGDSILVALPMLSRNADLLRRVALWIEVFLKLPNESRLSLSALELEWEEKSR